MSTHPQGGNYEHSDAQLKPLIVFAVALAVLIAVTLGIIASIQSSFERAHEAESRVHPLSDQRTPSNEPALQENPYDDIAVHRQYERNMLERYAWIDQENEIVRIPVERAMALVLERGSLEHQPQETDK